jgi:hypothetical protein
MMSVRKLVELHPDLSSREIADRYGRPMAQVCEARCRLKRPDHYREMRRRSWKRYYEAYAREHGFRRRSEILWPDDQSAYVKKWYGKKSAAEIGRKLGRSRNAVIGMANRLGLCKPHQDKGENTYRRDIADQGGSHVVDR